MEEPKIPARGRGVRSASSAKAKRYSTGAAAAAAGPAGPAGPEKTGMSLIPLGDASHEDEITALRLQLQEHLEKVSSLEALLGEKKFLQRHYEALGDRVRRHEEQLGVLAAVVCGEGPTLPSTGSKAQLPMGKAVNVPGASKGPGVTIHKIVESARQLRYDKHRMEAELVKKGRALEVARAELQQLLRADSSRDESLAQKPDGIAPATTTVTVTPDASTSAEAVDKRAVDALERTVAELREKHDYTEAKLVSYQKEFRAAKQKLRGMELELLEWQRKYRVAVVATTDVNVEERVWAPWKEAKNRVSTCHRRYFHGMGWVQLLQERPEALRDAFLRDASLELHAPHGFITVLEMQPGPELIAIDVDVQRPASITEQQVDLRLTECLFASMTELLQLRRDEPKKGWDVVQEQLQEARNALAKKEEEVVTLERRLRRVESSLEEQLDRCDADNALANQALNETEEILKIMLNELESQREREQPLRDELQNAKNELKRQEALAARQLEEVRCKASADLRDAEARSRKEVAETLRQLKAEAAAVVVAPPPLVTHVITTSWCDAKDVAREAHVLSFDSKVVNILHTLVLGEAAAAARAVPIKAFSLICTTQKLQAELQLGLNPPLSDSASVAESMKKFYAPVTTLFLREWQSIQELAEDRNREIERLTRELNLACGEAKQLEAQLRKERGRGRALEVEQREKRHLTEMLAASKQDLEKATVALEMMHAEHQRLVQETTTCQEEQVRMLRELQATREQKQRGELKHGILEDTTMTTAETLNRKLFSALRHAYEECDKAHNEYEIAREGWSEAEKLLREKLQERDVECGRLRLEAATLNSRLQESEREANVVTLNHQQTEAERDELLSRIQREMQELARRLAKNDSLQREAETTRKALELSVSQLTQQCKSLDVERQQLLDLSARQEEEVVNLRKKLGVLEEEMALKNLRAEELVHQLVREEDAHRALEIELKKLRRTLGTSSAAAAAGTPSAPEVQRLRACCQKLLQVPLTGKEQTVADIVTFMEQHCGTAVEEREQLMAALLSMNTAVQLLEHSIFASEELKRGFVGRRRTTAGIGNHSRSFGRSLSYSSGISPPVLSVRSSRVSGKAATSVPAAGAPPNTHSRQQQQQQQQRKTTSSAMSPTLASRAADVVQLVRMLATTLAPQRVSVKQQDLFSRGCSDLSELLARVQHPLVTEQQVEAQEQKEQKHGATSEVAAAQQDAHADFLRRSRAHALYVVLCVKDHLHDALAALQPLSKAIGKTVSNPRVRLAADSTHDVRMAEECVVYALKRIAQSAGSLFSSREKCEIEAKRGSNYFSTPTVRGGVSNGRVAGTPSPHLSPSKGQQQQQQQQRRQQEQEQEHRECNVLVPRNANMAPSPPLLSQGKKWGVPCDANADVQYRQHMRSEDQDVIQRALTEARRRKR